MDFCCRISIKFIVGGDINAKYPWKKGKELYKCITQNNYSTLSTGRPTHWPSDSRKTPDLLHFAIYFGISSNYLSILDSGDLSSDHLPLIVNFDAFLCTRTNFKIFFTRTDLNSFNFWLEKNIDLKI